MGAVSKPAGLIQTRVAGRQPGRVTDGSRLIDTWITRRNGMHIADRTRLIEAGIDGLDDQREARHRND